MNNRTIIYARWATIGTAERETRTGYKYDVVYYQAKNCNNCPIRGACHKQLGNREIEINKKLIRHKQIARNNLNSKPGKELRGRRLSEVEQTFGQIKSNKGFKRFLLKGIPKISIELGLLALAHNFQKLSKYLINNGLILSEFQNRILFCQNILKQVKLWSFINLRKDNRIQFVQNKTIYLQYTSKKEAA